jgi:hypothetical protein
MRVGLYPNPTNGLVNINTNHEVQMNYSVVDTQGRIVETDTFVRQHAIDLTGLSTGIYAVRLQWDGGEKTVRIQKF